MKTFNFLFNSTAHYTGLIIRLTLALVILPHGTQMLLGWFGGNGFSSTMQYFTQVEQLPWIIGFMVILIQSFGSIFILLGAGSRIVAFGLVVLFVGIIITSHYEHGFFMNWYGTQKGEGYEYHLLVIGLSLALMASGSGNYSLDRLLAKRFIAK